MSEEFEQKHRAVRYNEYWIEAEKGTQLDTAKFELYF
jgi:hypothetical protein